MIDLYVDEEKVYKSGACLKVVGIGGAGGNAVNSMIQSAEMPAIEYIVANTDAQALNMSPATHKIQLGVKITKGLGAGSNPDIGRRAAEEDFDVLMKHMENTDILFLTAGLGGGTGSGGLPVIASIAKEMGILTVAIITKPFVFEGKRRLKIAEEAVKNLKGCVDTLIVVPNQRLLEIVDAKISMLNAFALSNEILKQAIKGISDIITKSGHINVDFADVRVIMKDMGMALMGTGRARGEGRAQTAALKAISSPLLENVSIKGAKGVLINITGNTDLGLYEINEAASMVYGMVSPEANIILGSVIDPDIGDEIMVTVIATGFEPGKELDEVASVHADMHQVPHSSVSVRDIRKDVGHASSAIHGAKISQAESVAEKQEVRELRHEVKPVQHAVEAAEVSYDLEDLDTPTFLRKKSAMSSADEASAQGNMGEGADDREQSPSSKENSVNAS